ncbi:MAG: formyltetrahydrofolate deformylase, partial [Myxococcales bacterium]|nr:formyltetrahydrofolate deformylase [Myxococcales bacterium]
MDTATMLLSCADQPGLVAAVANFIFENGGNIVNASQHTDHEAGMFFQRIEIDVSAFRVPRREITHAFDGVAKRFGMSVSLRFPEERHRVAILASKQGHCLYDLLFRLRMGELKADVPLVISNHDDHADAVKFFGHAYHHLPIEGGDKAAQETKLLALLAKERIDLVILARYMQVLSPAFVGAYPHRVLNIHHSFLPAFVGAKPYHQAHERGVKLIG